MKKSWGACLVEHTPKIGIIWARLAGLWKEQSIKVWILSNAEPHGASVRALWNLLWKWGLSEERNTDFYQGENEGEGDSGCRETGESQRAYGTLFLKLTGYTQAGPYLGDKRWFFCKIENRKQERFAVPSLGVNIMRVFNKWSELNNA